MVMQVKLVRNTCSDGLCFGDLLEVSEDEGKRMIATGEAVPFTGRAQEIPEHEVWRYGLVEDVNFDSFQIAIEGVQRIRTALESESIEAIADRISRGEVLIGIHHHLVRWIHRTGYWVDSNPSFSPTDHLLAWLRSETAADKLIAVSEKWRAIRNSIPVECPQSCLHLLGFVNLWESTLQSHGSCFPDGNTKDFPPDEHSHPFSFFVKWQEFSDGSYLLEWMKRTATHLKFEEPQAELRDKFREAGLLCEPISTLQTPSESRRTQIGNLILHWFNGLRFRTEANARSKGEIPNKWERPLPRTPMRMDETVQLEAWLTDQLQRNGRLSFGLGARMADDVRAELAWAANNVLSALDEWDSLRAGRPRRYAEFDEFRVSIPDDFAAVVRFVERIRGKLQDYNAVAELQSDATETGNRTLGRDELMKKKAEEVPRRVLARDRNERPEWDDSPKLLARQLAPHEIYGSSLYWLHGWGVRLRRWQEDDLPPSQYDWMIFRPDEHARNAIDEFSIKYPSIIRGILDYLENANNCFEAFLDKEIEKTAFALAQAEDELTRRVTNGVGVIVEQEKLAFARLAAEQATHPSLTPGENAVLTVPTRSVGNAPTAKDLPPRIEQPYRMSLAAIEELGDVPDRELYDWVKEKASDELEIPDFSTWIRYVRAGRKHYGTNKNAPRNGRGGRSIIREDGMES